MKVSCSPLRAYHGFYADDGCECLTLTISFLNSYNPALSKLSSRIFTRRTMYGGREMNTLTIEGWCKTADDAKSSSIGTLHFRVDEAYHREMAEAEEALQGGSGGDHWIDVDAKTLELQTPESCGELADCRFRVYLGREDGRGNFHLVARRVNDQALVYSNAVMIDQLG